MSSLPAFRGTYLHRSSPGLYSTVTDRSLHFLTSTNSSSEDNASTSTSKYTECNTCCLLDHRGSSTVNSLRFGDGDAGASFATGHGECFPCVPSIIVNLGKASSINACTENISAYGRSLSINPWCSLTLAFSRRGRLPQETLLSVDFTILSRYSSAKPPGALASSR